MSKPQQVPEVPEVFDDLPEGEMDKLSEQIFEKKEQKLLNTNKFSIKSFKNGIFEDAYDGVFDLSSEESKKEFDFLTKVINKNNWYCIPVDAMKQFNDESCSLEDLEKLTKKSHENLNLSFIDFPKKEIKNNFIESSDDFKHVQNDSAKVVNNNIEPIKQKPKYIVSHLDITVKSKLNELNYRRDLVKKKSGISVKTIMTCGGLLAVGAVISPLSAITVPAATIVGLYAIGKAFINRDHEVKNFDKQIDLLKTAAKNLSKKSNLSNDDFKSILFGEPVEQEFARLCSRNNVQIDRVVFPKGYHYSNSDIDDLNR